MKLLIAATLSLIPGVIGGRPGGVAGDGDDILDRKEWSPFSDGRESWPGGLLPIPGAPGLLIYMPDLD